MTHNPNSHVEDCRGEKFFYLSSYFLKKSPVNWTDQRKINRKKIFVNMYWVGQNVCLVFFCKIRLIFHCYQITLLIWIFWVCWLSPVCHNVTCSQLMSWFDHCQLQLVYLTMGYLSSSEKSPAWNETLQTTFDTVDQSQHLLHTEHKPFFVFQLHFYLSWSNKA